MTSKIRLRNKGKIENELIECISIIKNLCESGEERKLTSEYAISYLADNMEFSQNAFFRMLEKIRLGQMKEAEKIFIKETRTKLSKDIAHILVRLDELKLEEIKVMLEARLEYAENVKKTKAIRKAELISDFVYFPIVMTVMMVLINFMVIAYYAPQKEQLAIFF